MFLPPDRQRQLPLPPARAFAGRIQFWLRAAAWHSLHPEKRERYVRDVPLPPLRRVYYTANDGWQCPLFYLPARPGGAGEPVVLCHGLGFGASIFRMGEAGGLAKALHQHGYDVYLMTYRGGRETIAPGRRTPVDVDSVWSMDVPAALEQICERSGGSRVHWIGHGFGGAVGIGYAALHGGFRLASMSTIDSSMYIEDRSRTHAGLLSAALRILPGHTRVPGQRFGRWMSLLIGETTRQETGAACPKDGSWMRTALNFAAEDTQVGLLKQVMEWLERGEMTTRGGRVSINALMGEISCPLLRIDSQSSPLDWIWGSSDTHRIRLPEEMAQWDLLLDKMAPSLVVAPLMDWLNSRRELAWAPNG